MSRVRIILVTALVAAALAAPGFAEPKRSATSGKPAHYVVTNANHTQRLGGRSERAWRGLSRAAERSRSVNPSKDGGTVPTPKP